MQTKLFETLEANKRKYDRQLYADWVLRVYDRCALACLHSHKSKIIKDTLVREKDDLLLMEQLKEYETNCGRNCIRKYDKVYRLFGSQEPSILRSFIEDEEITPEDFFKAAEKEIMVEREKDASHG
jgi:hypothetical protein